MTAHSDNPGLERTIDLATSRATAAAIATTVAGFLLVAAHVRATGTAILAGRYAILPPLWIGLSVWLVLAVRRVAGPPRRIVTGAAVAAAYFLLLAALGGAIGTDPAGDGLRIVPATPGWGPVVLYGGEVVALALVPFEVLGYAALAYAVYRVAATAAPASAVGAVGLFACAGCTAPAVATLSGLAGAPLTAAATGWATYDLATAIFAVTCVALLAVAPGREDVCRRAPGSDR